MHIRRIYLYSSVLSILLYLSLAGCAPKYLGPEVRRDGVYFSLYAPAAKSVAIAGSFNQWDVHRDALAGPGNQGVWNIILPLPVGRYEYLFFIDEKEWKLDPGTPWVDDGFGGKNSVVVIGE